MYLKLLGIYDVSVNLPLKKLDEETLYFTGPVTVDKSVMRSNICPQ